MRDNTEIERLIKESDNTWKDILIYILDSDKSEEAIREMSGSYLFEEELTEKQVREMRRYIENKVRQEINFPTY